MLEPAVYFVQVILALHILSVVVAFGVLFSYPLFLGIGMRLDPSAMPWFHRMQQAVSRWLVSPGLLLVVIFGVILASEDHAWTLFYVQWGVGAAIVIGAIEGMVMVPRAGRLAELAERDRAAAADGASPWSDEYLAARRVYATAATTLSAIVIVTVYLMAVQAGG